MKGEKPKIRKRWGVQHDFRDIGSRVPKWRTLGANWIQYPPKVPDFVDFWPASFRTRQEARLTARRLTIESQRHSAHWRFRAVALRIVVSVCR